MMEEFAVNVPMLASLESNKKAVERRFFFTKTKARELKMNVNIIGKTVPTSFDVVCSHCTWTGVATIPQAENLSELSVGNEITFKNGEDSHKCPSCNVGYIHGISGKYKRNKETNHMDRIGDFEE